MKLNYKNIVKLSLALCVLAGVGTGCKKFLEAPPAGSVTKDVAIADEAGLKTILNAGYQIVGGENMFGGKIQAVSEMMADQLNGTLLSGDFGEFYNRKSSFNGDYKKNMYVGIYQGIYRANTVLENLDKAAASTKDNFEGQARFIRALAHFELVKLFAQPYGFTSDNSHLGIPLKLNTKVESLNRSTVKQVYDQIIADLKLAEVKLPDDNAGYATKWAAKALLAKVYFQMNDFSNAYIYSNQVITSNKFSLDTYASRFAITGSKESIFRIIFTNGGSVDPGSELKNQFRSDFKLPELKFSTDFYATVNTANDVRKALFNNVKYPGFVVTNKYNFDRLEVPVLYFTEMKLIRAESAAETGTNLTVGAQDINDILARAYGGTKSIPLAASASLIKTNARFERSIELAGEGNRLAEIKRIGAKGENIDKRGAVWNCPGLILQFPNEEMATNINFIPNPEGGCN